MIQKVLVLGGGSSGFMAALALKLKLPQLQVVVLRSRDVGIIGVGEGSTPALTRFLHDFLQIGHKRFFQVAQPTWKLGLKFTRWGPRPHFYYPFGPGIELRFDNLPKPAAYYCDDAPGAPMGYEVPYATLMEHDKVFERGRDGGPAFHSNLAYHFENEKFVSFLEGYATSCGVKIVEDTVEQVLQDERGVCGLALKSGKAETADLYVDCSGFVSLLLGKALGEPFVSFKSSLFCDRAVVGGWDREAGDVIRPYTTCEAMSSGWCWQIEHESRVNRGYVYSSAFVGDEDAEKEFRARNPKVGPTRVVRFVSGRYERAWVKNVVAIGNASGFVEPLEATALGVIGLQSRLLATTLVDFDRDVLGHETVRRLYNGLHARYWDAIRAFIAVHYKFNARPGDADTPFWRECREKTDLAGAAPLVEHYKEVGPNPFWDASLLDPFDSFRMNGYLSILVGQQVPYAARHQPTDAERATWQARRRRLRDAAERGMTVNEALAVTRSPRWNWQLVERR